MARRAFERYRQVLVAVGTRAASDDATAIACRLAADRGAVVTLLTVVEVPAELPLEAQMPAEEGAGRRLLAEAHALAELYGVTSSTQVVRARSAAEAIVQCATASDAELVVLGASRRRPANRGAPVFGRTVGAVLAQAPCRVVVAAR